jgi:hypothetical protein
MRDLLPEEFKPLGVRVTIARKDSTQQIVIVEPPLQFSFFATQCHEKVFLGNVKCLDDSALPILKNGLAYARPRDSARESWCTEKLPGNPGENHRIICADLKPSPWLAPLPIRLRVFVCHNRFISRL